MTSKPGRRTFKFDGPDEVDVHVGDRLKTRRTLLGMSQTTLAEAIGLSFQQLQKYERGTNRISSSKLWIFAQALGVPVAFFFEGLNDPDSASADTDVTHSRETLTLVRAYEHLDAPAQAAILQLAQALADEDAPL